MMQFLLVLLLIYFNCHNYLTSGQDQNNDKDEPNGGGIDITTLVTTVGPDTDSYTRSPSDDLSDTLEDSELFLDSNDTQVNSTGDEDFLVSEDSNGSLPTTTYDPSSNITEIHPSDQIPTEALESGFLPQDFCLCDLKANVCDINCCCDGDCDDDDRKVFSHCYGRPQLVMDTRYCFQETLVFSNHTEYTIKVTDPGAFCIITDNLPQRTIYTLMKGASTVDEYQNLKNRNPGYSWAHQGSSVSSPMLKPYKAGIQLWGLDKTGFLFPLGIPSSLVGGKCETSISLAYLQDTVSTCNHFLQNLAVDCQSSLYLRAEEYVSLLVISDPRQLYKNESIETTTEVEVTSSSSSTPWESTSEAKFATTESILDEFTPSLPNKMEDINGPNESKLTLFLSSLMSLNLNSPSELNVDALLSITPYVCSIDDEGHDSCQELQMDSFPHPSYENGVCSNIVSGVSYVFLHKGMEGISEVKAKIYLKNANNSQNQVMQTFAVNYEWYPTDNKSQAVFQRSGHPGYVHGKPLLLGKLVENRTKDDILRVAISLSSNPNPWLTILSYGEQGMCSSFSPVAFGVDLSSSCLLELSQEDFLHEECNFLQEKILQVFFSASNFLNDKMLRVASYGDSDMNNPADWVPILVIDEPTCGTSGQFHGTNKHFSLVTALHLEVAFTLQGSLANPQAKVVGVSVRYGELREVHPHCSLVNCHWESKNSIRYMELKMSVSFVDVSPPLVPAYSQPPALDAKLPYDFFYPFLPSFSSSFSYLKYSSQKQFLLLTTVCLVMIKLL